MRELSNPLSRLVRLSVQNLDVEAGDAAVAPPNLVELLAGDHGLFELLEHEVVQRWSG